MHAFEFGLDKKNYKNKIVLNMLRRGSLEQTL